MKSQLIAVVFIQALLLVGCSNSGENNQQGDGGTEITEPGGVLPGYGDDEIGFRNQGANNGNGSADDGNGAPAGGSESADEDSGSDMDGDSDSDMDVDTDMDTDTDTDTEVAPDAGIDDGGPPESDVTENPFYTASEMPTNTFSIDVDTGSYTLVRQHLDNGQLPEAKSVRLEEMINYFKYNYEIPTGDNPFTIYTEMAECPWNKQRKLVMLGMRGQQVEMDDQPAANLVYLLDVSGSMAQELWLIKPAFRMLTKQLRPQDTLSIVTYAGNDSVVIDGGTGSDKESILAALDNLQSGGSTNGAGGIQKAYELAEKHFKPGGNNRVVLATDGDFNVGISSEEGLVDLIETKADSGVFLTVYGFSTWGAGNYQDSKMEQLANHGNGTYFFIDGEAEARRAFTHSLSGTLLTIAKDVKLQVQFNPDMVKGYRLIGYDNRTMSNDDFNNDSVDAGELGNAEDMTAFYEVILASSDESVPPTDVTNDDNLGSETEYEPLEAEQFMAVRMRYKMPDSDTSELLTHPISTFHNVNKPSSKFVFASTIAQLGLVLRESAYIENTSISSLRGNILDAFHDSSVAAVAELISLIDKADELL
ncbi:MAG: VWA domain-containing protein [Deltaproteobacteria bacterium]|nr:VWA domain-containing protein [Deltaproteobacteria bacterium]